MTAIAKLHRPTQSERVTKLEQRADKHDEIIKPMAEQVAEMYGLLDKARTINWFMVKIFAIGGGVLGGIAVVLTIAGNAAKLLGH